MKLNRKILARMMQYIEDEEEIFIETVSIKEQHYKVLPVDASHIADIVSKQEKCNLSEVYCAIHYAADRRLIDVKWRNGVNGVDEIKHITAAGHDYLSAIRGEEII